MGQTTGCSLGQEVTLYLEAAAPSSFFSGSLFGLRPFPDWVRLALPAGNTQLTTPADR